uniref:ATP synthase complex subunit 8 n=1 Tax=Lepidophyma flavimaculatum TaxID=264485 RepID=A1IGH3_9SAUR|nr:ATP synthase F0 subunit 8 [Lepidophyma flavimaculatum]BAF43983.1 ATPase subunit 8 [Lepidophyma flavimaculatum]
MPQLNPAPWFLILLMTWLSLQLMSTMKTLSVPTQNSLDTSTSSLEESHPWPWPWY